MRKISRTKLFLVKRLATRRSEKNDFVTLGIFNLFTPLFVRCIYRKYPTYISDKLYSKSDQKTRTKQVRYFRLISD